MSELSFADYNAKWGVHTLRSISAAVDSPRIALVGDWKAFAADLAGAAAATRSGSATLGGTDLRAQVIAGRAGVARLEQHLPGSSNVAPWLSESLRLLGLRDREAKRQVEQVLDGLGLSFLGPRRIETLSPAEIYGARLAFALVTQPTWVLVPAPNVPHALLPFCLTLLDRVATRAQVCVLVETEPAFNWWAWCSHVLYARAGDVITNCSVNRWRESAISYQLRTVASPVPQPGPSGTLESHLREQGVEVANPGGDPLRITLPVPGATDRILRACRAASASLLELTPLLFAPTAG